MSKKTFSSAPRPKPLTPETIDAYVQGGAGHDTHAPAPKAIERAPEGPTKRLSLDLPEDAHRRFKVACAATGRKMAAELTAFIERRTKELEQQTHN